MKFYFIGAGLVAAILWLGFSYPRLQPVCIVLLEPGTTLAARIPGGLMHNPLAIIVALVTQVLLYAHLALVLRFLALRLWGKE